MIFLLPTSYLSLTKTKKEKKMAKWECRVCGYVYDPAKGDEDNGVKPGTAFEKVPEDWMCPACGASKDLFDKLD